MLAPPCYRRFLSIRVMRSSDAALLICNASKALAAITETCLLPLAVSYFNQRAISSTIRITSISG